MAGIFTFIADEIVEQINTYQKQNQQCEQTVGNIRQGMNPIQGGAWVGQGATAFIQEVISKLIPDIMQLIAAIAGFGGGMGKALNIMQNADKMVSGIASQAANIFDRVF
jgi:WXG100 family type VII secretion target